MLVCGILRLLARLPLAWLHARGRGPGLAGVLGVARPTPRGCARICARAACAAAKRSAGALLRAAIAEAGKGATELIAVWFGDDEKVARLVVEATAGSVVEAARARGKGIIFLTPHLGCFEIAALYGAQRVPLTVLYRPPKLGWLEPLMLAGRSRWQAVLAPANLRGVRMLYRALRARRGRRVAARPGAGRRAKARGRISSAGPPTP